MGSPAKSHSGNVAPVRVTQGTEDGHAGLTTRVAASADVGLLTRVISWAIDLLLINLVAIITGLGIALVVTVFPITKSLKPLFEAIAGGVYVLWAAAYFVALWSITGQTLGSRVMQVRLVTASGGKVKPVRAFVRWIGMNLGMIPLPWGYVPIPFRRLGFPDWLAHTRVIEAPQQSIAAARQERLRDAAERDLRQSPREPSSSLIRFGDDHGGRNR